jgi:hypothetical protein
MKGLSTDVRAIFGIASLSPVSERNMASFRAEAVWYGFATLAVAIAMQLVMGQPSPGSDARPAHSIVVSTPIEKALDEFRARFPKTIVIGFEEVDEPRPETEPQIDLGPASLTFNEVLERVRKIDSNYRVELLKSGLVRVYPVKGTADPAGLLDIRLRRFVMPRIRACAKR